MNMPIKDFDTALPRSSDEETEAQAFRELEAAQRAACGLADGIVVFQYPDNRTVFQRLHAWWYLRQQKPAPQKSRVDVGSVSEPEWPRHWATTKYI